MKTTMKQLVLAVLVLASSHTMAQENTIPKVDGSYEYTEVVQLDSSYTKEMLYKNAKLFFVDNFKSAKDVIQYDEAAEGRIIGKGFLEVKGGQAVALSYFGHVWSVNYTTEFICKDGKYKYRLYAFSISDYMTSTGSMPSTITKSIDDVIKEQDKGITKKSAKKMYAEMLAEFDKSIAAMKYYMSKKTAKAKDDF